jgi:nucleoid DNA-binding protein
VSRIHVSVSGRSASFLQFSENRSKSARLRVVCAAGDRLCWVVASLKGRQPCVVFGFRTPGKTASIGETEKFLSFSVVLFNLLENIMAKQKTGKTETSARVIKQTLTKSALINLIAEQNDIPRKTAIGVFNTLESVMLGSVHPRGVGEFTLPGLFKINLRKVPARKAGTLIRNPATGEMMKGAAKPASVRVKIRALSKLKGAAIS